MSARLVGALAAIVVLGGGGVAFVLMRESGAAEERRAELLRAADAELGTDLPDRDELTRLLKELDRLRDEEPHEDLRRAVARVQLRLGRADDAWETIGTAATSPGASAADRLIGARVLTRIHAATGDAMRGKQAITLARGVFEETGSIAAAFLAWQCAYRTDNVTTWIDLDRVLDQDGGETIEARTVRLLGHHMALQLADRLGVEGGIDEITALAANADAAPEIRALSRYLLETRERGELVTEESLSDLDRIWGRTPAELLVLMARGRIAKADALARAGDEEAGRDELETAVDYLREVLESCPTSVEARHLASVADHGLGRETQRIAHARWLLENAPSTDARRSTWASLAQ